MPWASPKRWIGVCLSIVFFIFEVDPSIALEITN